MSTPEHAGGGSARHALIISHTPVTDEPRVRRQAQALHDAGWLVSVAGFHGRGPVPDFWRHIEIAHVGIGLGLRHALRSRVDKDLSRVSEGAAERAYWSAVNYEGMYQQLAYVDPAPYDLVLAHDWNATPLAERLARKLGIPFSIDVHEYARGQYMANRSWRWRERPWIHALQKRYLPRATGLTVICDGIADLLGEEYSLPERPTVVRSFAQHRELPFHPTGEHIRALYHGAVAPARGLEEAIASTPLWRPEFHLVIRGDGPADYLAQLRSSPNGLERVSA